jgi:clan AA aspartic protease
MIEGFFGSKGELYFDIDLITDTGEVITVTALLDTGFTDWLALNAQDVLGLGWRELERREMATALGEGEFLVYEGRVVFDALESIVPVLVGDGITEILIGLKWLEKRRLIADRPKNSLILADSSD